MPYRLIRPISLLLLSGGAFVGSAAAQEIARGPDQDLIGETITVTATRTERSHAHPHKARAGGAKAAPSRAKPSA